MKNLPAMQEPQEWQVRSLSQEDPLEEGMATHSSILAWRIPWNERAWQATVHRVAKRQAQMKQLSTHTHLSNEGNREILHQGVTSSVSFLESSVRSKLE